jgi:hypothetical protein
MRRTTTVPVPMRKEPFLVNELRLAASGDLCLRFA